jgi:hypothetical protein
MRHDWIFDVLTDLRSYAEKNDLPAVAGAAARALDVAHAEIAAQSAAEGDAVPLYPASKRPN